MVNASHHRDVVEGVDLQNEERRKSPNMKEEQCYDRRVDRGLTEDQQEARNEKRREGGEGRRRSRSRRAKTKMRRKKENEN